MGAMMMRSGVSLLALLVLMLMVSQASDDIPFPPTSSDAPAGGLAAARRLSKEGSHSQASDLLSPSTRDAPAGGLAARAPKEGKAVVFQASGLLSPLTSADASAGLAAGSAEGEAVVAPSSSMASDHPVPSPWSANAPSSGPAAAEKKQEAGTSKVEQEIVIGGPKEIRDRVVLVLANALTMISSIYPFVLRWGYGSWCITRIIFPAKAVACNFIASGAWTVYIILEMYAENNYAGQDAIMVNCLAMGINLVTLVIYFLHGRESKRFWASMTVFLTIALAGLIWLVWHPNIIQLDKRKTIYKKDTQVFGVIGMAVLAIINFFPFTDLWAMTTGDTDHFLTLLFPIMMNTFLSSIVGGLWTGYAWLFAPRHPNYFMYANCMTAVMTFSQVIWLLILYLKNKVEGLIIEVETLRAVLLSVSGSLRKLERSSERVWSNVSFETRVKESMQIGWQSLMLVAITLNKLEADLQEKTNAAAAAYPEGNQSARQTCARAALEQYPILFAACRETADALEAVEKSIVRGHVLKGALENASDVMDVFAASVRPSMQVINAAQGIPATIQFAFEYCREKLMLIKTVVDCEISDPLMCTL